LAASTWQTKSDLFKYPRISEQRRNMSSGPPVGELLPDAPPEAGSLGTRIMALADRLAEYSESRRGLTCTYLSPAHRAVAMHLRDWMQAAGMAVAIDPVANVVGRYAAADPDAKTLIVGSHYDTVRDAGKYDGRLGILAALVVVEHLERAGVRLPYHLELIAFSEEEGVRFSKPFIGSSAVAGRFDPAMLDLRDAAGFALSELMQESGLEPGAIGAAARDPADLLGYLEVHIEQGPVLLQADLPLGIVTAINGGVRQVITVTGTAGHAGTVPMAMRHDAAAAAAEIVLAVERRCAQSPGLVGTVGQLAVPNGAINVIPGCCELSIDIRAGDDATRDAAVDDIHAEIERVAGRRGVEIVARETLRTPAASCAPHLQAVLAEAVARAGAPTHYLASGAGHDALMFGGVTDIGMLFVRCGNGGISHNPLETVAAEDADIAARALLEAMLILGESGNRVTMKP
jgi:hydantoinase/carbamoylase family amidase